MSPWPYFYLSSSGIEVQAKKPHSLYRRDRPGCERDDRLLSTLRSNWDCTILSAGSYPDFPSSLDTMEDLEMANLLAMAEMRREFENWRKHKTGRP